MLCGGKLRRAEFPVPTTQERPLEWGVVGDLELLCSEVEMASSTSCLFSVGHFGLPSEPPSCQCPTVGMEAMAELLSVLSV